MRILNLVLIGLLAVSVSSCRSTESNEEPSLETQLTPVKPDAEAPAEGQPEAPEES